MVWKLVSSPFGFLVVYWSKLLKIVLSWVISPVVGGILAYFVFKILTVTILHRPNPLIAAKKVAPIMIGFTFFLISFLFTAKTLKKTYEYSTIVGLILGFIAWLVSYFLVIRYVRRNSNDYDAVESIFKRVQVLTSAYVCFSHGANDVANAVGPIALIFMIQQSGVTNFSSVEIPKYILFIGGLGIALGVLLYGYKVMQTIGHDITELNNTRGFSIFGFPISTTHTVVGAATGVGLARGIEVVNTEVLKEIVISWLITIPFSAGVSAIIYLALTKFL